MRTKTVSAALSLIFFLCANFSVGYRVSVGGTDAEGVFSRRQVELACRMASDVLEEISGGAAQCPSPALRPVIALRFTGSARELTDAVLSHTYGVEKVCTVYARDTYLGKVADRDEMEYRLRRNIYDQMPLCAVKGEYAQPYRLEEVYSTMGGLVPYEDMVLLVSGRTPVMYYTAEGDRA